MRPPSNSSIFELKIVRFCNRLRLIMAIAVGGIQRPQILVMWARECGSFYIKFPQLTVYCR